ncbi:LutC/YkgG family protein [Paenibacillus alkalitolerans]|uniref:LutC/YkgG family protein n=1 Tax=Paenibacillus alkalitolerans TaxID=2799335 RepID=UPI0018F62088|nr:lactate utilization protein C [Paenibacillus alkalitolerans]
MAESSSHQTWLQELEAQSRAKQEAFMNNIAKRLNRPRIAEKPAHPFRGAPDFWNAFEWSVEERVERFSENIKNAGGHPVRLDDMEQAKRFILEKAGELGAKFIIRQNEKDHEELGLESGLPDVRVSVWNSDPQENWKARAAEADMGIVTADFAAAYTGTIMVKSAASKGRSVSLLPTVLIAIIPVERLKTRLGEVLPSFDEAGRANLPAGIHFISGPSRSADIENDLTIGVHGPGVVYALLVG